MSVLTVQEAGATARSVAVAVGVGLACFAASAIGVGFSGLLTLGFALAVAVALARVEPRRTRVAARVLLAVTWGFSAAWLGVVWNVDRFDLNQPAEHEVWLAEHGANRVGYETLVVTGFPIQGVEGHGGGGAPEYLPPHKGLGVLLANFLLCSVAFAALAFCVPAGFVVPVTGIGIALALGAGLAGAFRLMWLLD